MFLCLQACHSRESGLQDQLHSCNANLAQLKREKEEMSISLQERSLQLAGLHREAADKKRALDLECEKLSREKHKRQRVEEDNKVEHCNTAHCRLSMQSANAAADSSKHPWFT